MPPCFINPTLQGPVARRNHKFGAVATWVDGIRFPSKAEANRFRELQMLLKSGKIYALELQPRFALHVNGVKIGTYVADFQYYLPGITLVVEDVKGMRTALYKWKKKHFEAEYETEITEITGRHR